MTLTPLCYMGASFFGVIALLYWGQSTKHAMGNKQNFQALGFQAATVMALLVIAARLNG